MYNKDIILHTSQFFSTNDIKNIFKATLDPSLCLEITKLHIVSNLPQYSHRDFMRIASFRELFTLFPDIYYILFNKNYLSSHISHNMMIENDLKKQLKMEMENVYKNKNLKELKVYWKHYFGKVICYRTFNLLNETVWKIYDSINSTEIEIGDMIFNSYKGIIRVYSKDVIVYKIDIRLRLICYLDQFEYKDEIEFYLNNPYYLKCIGKVKYI